MNKRKLDLTNTLLPIDNELKKLLGESYNPNIEEDSLFNSSVNEFINKYGKLQYQSLDEILEKSYMEAKYIPKQNSSFNNLIKELTS